MADLFAALTGLNNAVTIARTLVGIRDEVKLNSAVIDLQNTIIDAQSKVLSAQQEHMEKDKVIETLEAQIKSLQDWSSERDNYQLVRMTFNGVHVYIPKTHSGRFETALKLCPSCFQKGNKSILQDNFPGTQATGRRHVLICSNGCVPIAFERFLDPAQVAK